VPNARSGTNLSGSAEAVTARVFPREGLRIDQRADQWGASAYKASAPTGSPLSNALLARFIVK